MQNTITGTDTVQQPSVGANWSETSSAQEDVQGLVDNLNVSQKCTLAETER